MPFTLRLNHITCLFCVRHTGNGLFCKNFNVHSFANFVCRKYNIVMNTKLNILGEIQAQIQF